MKAKVTLGIGYGSRDDIIDIDDDEWADCETDEERNDLLQEYWEEWSNNYIDGSITPIND